MENEQINVIMEREGLTASQFATLIGIQRAQVSHLQSNRNRVSLDIVKRIHAALPAISLEWLLTGSGSYYAAAGATSESAQPSAPTPIIEQDLFNESEEPMQVEEEVSEPAENRKIPYMERENADFCKDETSETPQNKPQQPVVQHIECEKSKGRNILEIKIFYDDGTYETFCRC